ncbi:SAM-dependent methyltransferase [Kribbella aluminosa]|uniref:SAM-dependent methyltransferase n=1 Tax=Kribbella aluminosa TaxID=416017 RepID=A0ABS4URT6_9ACTN|nr:class I SAM-dependent methyltransferase [Kribbella aluminosa]MBP2354344.1 SAM-dependent methyltransferase [Kribbella aluminosa]
MDPWQTLTTDYEQRRAREDSLDQLMEWDAQRSLIGPVEGRTILDVGCGNGGKAIELVQDHGAASVVGVDIGAQFLTPPAGVDVAFHSADLSALDELHTLQGRRFDVVLFLQSLAYARDRVRTLRAVRSLMTDGGVLVVSMAHPIRYAVERSERDGTGIGDAYHAVGPYSYPSRWNPHKQAWLSQYVGIIIFRARPA